MQTPNSDWYEIAQRIIIKFPSKKRETLAYTNKTDNFTINYSWVNMIGHWWLYGRKWPNFPSPKKEIRSAQYRSSPRRNIGKTFLAKYRPPESFLGYRAKCEKLWKLQLESFFFLFEICIHYFLYREFHLKKTIHKWLTFFQNVVTNCSL